LSKPRKELTRRLKNSPKHRNALNRESRNLLKLREELKKKYALWRWA
jgi:hypothetical protein